MSRHLKLHPNMYKEFLEKKQALGRHHQTAERPILQAIRRQQPLDKDSTKAKQLTTAVAMMIIKDLQPFSFVDDKGFKNFVQVAEPRYQLPSRTTFSRTIIPQMYKTKKDEVFQTIQRELNEGVTSIALTTDGWTSIAVESYMSLTLNYITKNVEARHFMLEIKHFGESHTSQHLFEFVTKAMEEWKLQQDETTTIYFVTDNAPNIVRALSMNEDWIRIPCFAHTLQLCVKDATKACKGFVELCRKCRGIVGFFGRSSSARQSLLKTQKVTDPNIIPLDLIQDVDTRWNSQYDMFERLGHLRRALGAVLSEPKMPDNLTGTEWNMVVTYVRLLAPLKDSTVFMSGEDYPTLSTYIPIVDGLIKATQTFIDSGSEGNLLGRNLLASLNSRFDGRNDNIILLMAMLTDPRYKNRLLPDGKKPAAIETLRQKILSLKNRREATDRPLQREELLQHVISKTAVHQSTLFDFLDDINQSDCYGDPAESELTTEIERFFNSRVVSRDVALLEWWRNNEVQYPSVALVAKNHAAIPATQVSSERLFSTAGNIVTARRVTLLTEHVEELCFLNKNMEI